MSLTQERRLGTARRLLPYLSVTHAQWLAEDPERSWREIDGTLVFADVSGFTALAEKLARGGKVGAEALTGVLNDLFGRLLAAAGNYGGDCLKFGGDALLLLFTGPDHATRGVAAAHELVDITQRFRPHRSTSASSVRLGMSVGAGSGPILFLLSGTGQREMLVVGPTVSDTLHAEHEAVSGQVLLSDALAAMTLPAAVPAPLVDPPSEWENAAQLGLSPQLVTHLTGEVQDGEHRLAGIGFVRFTGSDELLIKGGPQALADAMHALVSRAQQAERDHGVTLISTDADLGAGKLILVAGVPTSSPDEADRLLHALRDIVDRGGPLPLMAGAHYGRVFTADLGAAHRRTFTVMGDAVNLSARLMAHATPGQVLASRELLERLRTNFHITPVEPFAAKGKSLLVESGAVGDALGLRSIDDLDDLPLVGRDEELAVLMDAAQRVAGGTGDLVQIVSEAGLGKSKLLRTFAAEADLPKVELRGGGYSRATPFFALRAPLRALLGITTQSVSDAAGRELTDNVRRLAPDLVEWLPLIAPVLGLELPATPATARIEADYRPAKVRSLLTDLFRRLLPDPTLWLVEDAHALDGASADLVLALIFETNRPWLFAVSRRPREEGLRLDPDWGTTLILTVLSDEAAAGLLEASLIAGGQGLVPGTAEQLVKRAGGNPLFLRELLLVATSRSLDDLPESIEAVVSTMIDTLPAQDRDLLRRAAVLGNRFPVEILAATLATTPESLLPHLSPLRSFLHLTDGGVEFSHLLLRDVAYETLPYRARRALHARAGAAWEAQAGDRPDDVAELLSVHFHAAGSHAKSWRYSLAAAERAERAAAPMEAAAFYERALEASGRLSDVTAAQQASTAERLGDATLRAGRYDEARRAYGRARRLEADPLTQARLHRKIGTAWEQEARYAASVRVCRRGLAIVAPYVTDPRCAKEASKLLSQEAVARLRAGRHADARPMLREAVRLADGNPSRGHRTALANAYRYSDWMHIELQEEPPLPYHQLAEQLYTELDNSNGLCQIYNNMGNWAYYRGDWRACVKHWERARLAAVQSGSGISEALVLNNLAEVLSDQGRVDEAEEQLRSALTTFRGARHGFEGLTLSLLSRAVSRAGRRDEALALFDQACDLLERNKEVRLLAETIARRAELHAFMGESESALACVTQATKVAAGRPLPLTQPLLSRVTGWALAQQGDSRGAWRLFSKAVMDSRARKDEYGAAVALQELARLAERRGETGAVTRFAAFAQELQERLGVVSMPSVPLEPTAAV